MRVAVVGTGSIGRRHLANLLDRADVEAMAVSEYGRRAGLEVGGRSVPVWHVLDDALRQCDAVVVANPSGLHLDTLGQALAAGKHVYLEKPVGPESAGFGRMAEMAAEAGLVVAVGTQFRFNPVLMRAKQLLEADELGKLLNVFASSGEHIADYHPEEDYRTSYAARRELGGGVLLTQIHQVDYLNWLFGPFETVSAVEVMLPELEIDVEASVTYMLAAAARVPVVGHLNYVQRPRRTGLEVIGSRASLSWSHESNRLSLRRAGSDESETVQEPLDRNRMFVDAMDDFFDAVENGTRPRADLTDGIEAVRIVEAIKRSASEGSALRMER